MNNKNRNFYKVFPIQSFSCLSQWPRGLRRRSAAARLLRSWVWIPPGGMDICMLCVLSGRGLCDELITRPEESYRLWCVAVCDLETSWMRRPWPALGPQRHRKKKIFFLFRTHQKRHRKPQSTLIFIVKETFPFNRKMRKSVSPQLRFRKKCYPSSILVSFRKQ